MTRKEEWRSVTPKAFRSRYEVSNFGRVRSLWMGDYLRPEPRVKKEHRKRNNRLQTLLVAPPDHRKYYMISRLVLSAFVGPCPPGHECAHLDGDPTNNMLENLVWATKKENASHKILHGTDPAGERNPAAKMTFAQVEAIREMLESGMRPSLLARIAGVSETAIGRIAHERGWRRA